MMPTNHGVVGMTKTADGRIVSTKTYQSFPYKVTIEHDGAIRVKHGDWLSKYSAAMYNNFNGIHEFARKGRDGKLRRIPNPNLIYAGETIYHVPTYKYAHPMRMDQVEMVATPWSDDEIEANIVKALNQEHQFSGEPLHVLTEAVHILHKTADYADGAVLLGEMTEILAEGTALASATGLIAAVLTPIMVGLSILDANDTDRRIAACQAIGYALTAWAF